MATISPAELARMRVVYEVPGMDQVEVRRNLVYHEVEGTRMAMDVYLPAARPAGGARPPAVLLIHGGPVPVGAYPRVKDMGVFVSWGQLLAASGMAAVTFNHLHHGWHDLAESADHVAAVIAYLSAEADALGIDADRLCLWAFSGGGPQLAPALSVPDPRVRCLVGYYPLLDLRHLAARLPEISAETLLRFSPAACLGAAAAPAGMPAAQAEATAATEAMSPPAPPARHPLPPLLLARAGRDQPYMNDALDGFVQAALAAGVELELWNHAAGQHGFDVMDDCPRTRRIAARTIEFIRGHCAAGGAADAGTDPRADVDGSAGVSASPGAAAPAPGARARR
jgi:acetyl esterase/lipase